jgi:hypothetical protein
MNNTWGVIAGIVAGTWMVVAVGATWISGAKANPSHPDARVGPVRSERLAPVGEAAGAHDVTHIDREWREAYRAASRSRQWEALVTVGDAAAGIDGAAGRPTMYRAEARRAYLEALFRARAQGSADGIRRAAEAFEKLGDREAAELGRRMLRTTHSG